MRERAPWYRRRLGRLGRLAVVLVVASAAVGFLSSAEGSWRLIQVGLVIAAATAYLVALVRSPD